MHYYIQSVKSKNEIGRDYTIDLLRCLGTFSVILAHIDPPNTLLQVRAYDVIMLVFISGMSFSKSPKSDYLHYLIRRSQRLLKPTYICITLLFAMCYVACLVLKRQQLYTLSEVFYSYILSDHGMGYIWIAKVYLLIAIISPFLVYINKKTQNDFMFASLVFLFVFIHSFIINVVQVNNIIFTDYLFYIIPYCGVAILGMRWCQMSYLSKIFTFFSSSVIAVAYIVSYEDFCPNIDKFPPRMYYFSYGVALSIIAFCLFKKISPYIQKQDRMGFVTYVSKLSYNIYLSHIVVMLAFNMLVDCIKVRFLQIFIIHYLIIIIVSVMISLFIDRFQLANNCKSFLKNFINKKSI